MKTNQKPTTDEVIQISEALIRWFESQDVDPTIAGIVMANVVASDLVTTAPTIDLLEKGYNIFGKLLRELIEEKWEKRHSDKK